MHSLLMCTWAVVQMVIWITAAHEGHEHYVPRADRGEDLADPRFTRDTRHIKEDIEEYFQMNMTSVEHLDPKNLDYYYFVLHDFDKNNKLDGLEMLKAIQHVIEHNGQVREEPIPLEALLANFATAIDHALTTDDLDKDGFISYAEYSYAQQRYQPEPATTTAPV